MASERGARRSPTSFVSTRLSAGQDRAGHTGSSEAPDCSIKRASSESYIHLHIRSASSWLGGFVSLSAFCERTAMLRGFADVVVSEKQHTEVWPPQPERYEEETTLTREDSPFTRFHPSRVLPPRILRPSSKRQRMATPRLSTHILEPVSSWRCAAPGRHSQEHRIRIMWFLAQVALHPVRISPLGNGPSQSISPVPPQRRPQTSSALRH